ncbi:MAG: hypothetical protein OXI01_23040 [Albidovulum sp.]|nr:hypothetical protein [Albidovulum sp.]
MTRSGKIAIAIATVAATILTFVAQARAQDEGVGEIQAMLAECGFNPGPADGLWGNTVALSTIRDDFRRPAVLPA